MIDNIQSDYVGWFVQKNGKFVGRVIGDSCNSIWKQDRALIVADVTKLLLRTNLVVIDESVKLIEPFSISKKSGFDRKRLTASLDTGL